MAGTKTGGAKAARTNKKLYGSKFYKNIGREGGLNSNPNKGFGSMTREQRSELGRKGFEARMRNLKNR